MYDDLTGLHVGDLIYTTERYTDRISVRRMAGETPTAWVIKGGSSVDLRVRKKDGYMIGSNTGGRCPDSIYYSILTPEIMERHNQQKVRRAIMGLGTAKVQVTAESYAELKAAVDTIYRHVIPALQKS